MNTKTGIQYKDVSIMNAMLIKDKANKLILFARDRFVFMVDHYAAVDARNTAFKLYGKPLTVVNTENGKYDFSRVLGQFTTPYREAITGLILSRHICFEKIFHKKTRIGFVILSAFIRLFSFGFLRVNPSYLISYEIPVCPILTGTEENFSSIIISPQFFDKLIRIQNVDNIIIDFDKIWKEVVASANSSQTAVAGKADNTSSPTV